MVSQIYCMCKAEGCQNTKIVGYGYCKLHYRRWKNHGDPHYTRPLRNVGTCCVKGCSRQASRKGMCYAHYQKAWKYGDPLITRIAPRNSGICAVEGCSGMARTQADTDAGRYCEMHYYRLRRNGTLGTVVDTKTYDSCRECSGPLPVAGCLSRIQPRVSIG